MSSFPRTHGVGQRGCDSQQDSVATSEDQRHDAADHLQNVRRRPEDFGYLLEIRERILETVSSCDQAVLVLLQSIPNFCESLILKFPDSVLNPQQCARCRNSGLLVLLRPAPQAQDTTGSTALAPGGA